MTVVPFKFRKAVNGQILFTDDGGRFFRSSEAFLERYVYEALEDQDLAFLEVNGFSYTDEQDLAYAGFAYAFASRLYLPRQLDYIILVPTLRCNLACSYCQVSRVNEATPGFDWTDETLVSVLHFLSGLQTRTIKVEFQGGEPLLRLDLLLAVRDFCNATFEVCEFVVCTNLQVVSPEAWAFLALPDVSVSTSLDGSKEAHLNQRTSTVSATNRFFENLMHATSHLGEGKVSALPTIDPRHAPSPRSVIEMYASFNMRSIYIRPVNFQGFARKRFDALATTKAWIRYYSEFLDAAIVHNWEAVDHVEEYYFVHCLRRVLRAGHDGHVDLRNPNILGSGYLVIDHDGRVYPTDEARMVTRVGQMDLSVGHIASGIDQSKVDALNEEASNNFHPDCVHCVYQPFCGVDLIDDLSRYGRIDLPKHQTDFCQRHMAIFDKVFELLYSEDPRVQKSLAMWAGSQSIDPLLVKAHA
ncbi:His-Xaa-Ser system radical SAM maturase HxsB [Rhizobium sp. PP-CC-3A-592]|nr:His-Xaa-Ser system radical SAM maturase HxsB [Rhizobium sp. PP-CC-3A-592]